jgi:hypothetical protein
MLAEDSRNGKAYPFYDLVVKIHEPPTQSLCQGTPDLGLPAAHETDQEHPLDRP